MNAQATHELELLAPAGSAEAFRAALAAGADAIYCALGGFLNARRKAVEIDDETFAALCREAHIAGTRVYLTLNVVVREDEMEDAVAVARHAHELGADAFIIQDWGLFAELHARMPELELHVSTQANVHDARGVLWSARQGATRVTLSRELSLEEMETCAATGIDVECFGHGAICFCYSGICFMSSMRGGRSANRGLCAQPCRLPYELVREDDGKVCATLGERLLCPRDMCTLDHVGEMLDAGVRSLKVEGRMKDPDYVYSVVSSYRGVIDDARAGSLPEVGEDARRRRALKRAFNRDFTDAYFRGTSGNEMMSYERSNNRGELVGRIVSSVKLEDEVRVSGGARQRVKRHPRAELIVALEEPVGEGDLLEVRPSDDPSLFFTSRVNAAAAAGDEIRIMGVRTAPVDSPVRVIRSEEAFVSTERALSRAVARKRPVNVWVTARLGEPFEVRVETTDGEAQAVASGFVVEAARTRAVTSDEVAEHVGRMGASAFEPVSIDVELDEGCGMAFSAVHAVRSDALSKLEDVLAAEPAKRTGPLVMRAPISTVDLCTCHDDKPQVSPQIAILAPTPEVAHAAAETGATRIYATADALALGEWPEGTIPWLDEVCREGDHVRLDPLVSFGDPVAVGNVSELALAVERGAFAEIRPCIPVHNSRTARALTAAGASAIWLTPELTLDEITRLAPRIKVPVGLVVWGRARVMTSEHCVLQALGNCSGMCETCPRRAQKMSLKNIDGNLFPVRTDIHGRSRIYHAWPLDATPQVEDLLAAGVSLFMVDATLLSAEEAVHAVKRVRTALDAAATGGPRPKREAGTVSGHLFQGIG